MTTELKKDLMYDGVFEALERFDFPAFAEAYRKSEIAWSAVEWKNFIREILRKERAALVEEIEENKYVAPFGDEYFYNEALTEIQNIIKEKDKESARTEGNDAK